MFRWHQLLQRDLTDRRLYEQLQIAAEPTHYPISTIDGLPRLLFELFRLETVRYKYYE